MAQGITISHELASCCITTIDRSNPGRVNKVSPQKRDQSRTHNNLVDGFSDCAWRIAMVVFRVDN